MTTSRVHAPSRLSCAISRMASTDSSFAVSMNAQVLTTMTSAVAASAVISCPASRAIAEHHLAIDEVLGTAEARRNQFSFTGIHPVQHPRIRNRFAQVVEAADPGHDALDAHAEAGVRDAAEAAQVEVPLERFVRQLVLLDALQQQVVVVEALAAADDLAVAFGREDVDRERRPRAARDAASCRTP